MSDVSIQDNQGILTADEVIVEIGQVLSEWDGKDIERIANQILFRPVTYTEDSFFTREEL